MPLLTIDMLGSEVQIALGVLSAGVADSSNKGRGTSDYLLYMYY